MIRRFYVHNFRCLENFELQLGGRSSTLLIGNNGSGKSTVADALAVLQTIGRGTNVVANLVRPSDFSGGRQDVPMRFEIEVELKARQLLYSVAFEVPRSSGEVRVKDERFVVDGEPVFSRDGTKEGQLNGLNKGFIVQVSLGLVALPILDQGLMDKPLSIFRRWLARMLILSPIPGLILGDTTGETLEPKADVTNFGGWFAGVLDEAPSAYTKMESHLKQMLPDFKEIKNSRDGRDRGLSVQFSKNQGGVLIPFRNLSDGEKCFMICALVLAMNDALGPVFCFWDEPDNFLALKEVGHFVMELRRAFQNGGQFIATSHNPETIRRFSRENTLFLHRRSHLEPTVVSPLSELQVNGDLVSALTRGDVEP